MPDIVSSMNELEINQKFYKLIEDTGDISYVSERELNARGIKIPSNL